MSSSQTPSLSSPTKAYSEKRFEAVFNNQLARRGGASLLSTVFASLLILAAPSVSLAAGPDVDRPREMDSNVRPTDYNDKVFKADPTYEDKPYNAEEQIKIYGGKRNLKEPRPIIEIGQPQYIEGPFNQSDGFKNLGNKNPFSWAFSIFGDFRSAVATNDVGNDTIAEWANVLNLDLDLKITSTERIHAFLKPIDQGAKVAGFRDGDDNGGNGFNGELDAGLETLFFEGDLGVIASGLTDTYQSQDLPFSFGLMPLIMQNGLWVDDAFLGAGLAFPSMNSPMLDITNMDITLFSGFGEIDSAAITDANGTQFNNEAMLFGAAAFIEWFEGYSEFGIGYVEGTKEVGDVDYFNITGAFTRRYGGWLSNSVRLFSAVGQDTNNRAKTADGFALLVENSLISSKPGTYVPYGNFWIGIDRPQPLAKNNGGILRNTGITFEADGMTGFPKLDDTANDTFGGAIGINYLFSLDQQLVVEASTVQMLEGDNQAGQAAQGAQYGIGFRYQRPITNRVIVRADGIYGIRENANDVAGVRFEIRVKF